MKLQEKFNWILGVVFFILLGILMYVCTLDDPEYIALKNIMEQNRITLNSHIMMNEVFMVESAFEKLEESCQKLRNGL